MALYSGLPRNNPGPSRPTRLHDILKEQISGIHCGEGFQSLKSEAWMRPSRSWTLGVFMLNGRRSGKGHHTRKVSTRVDQYQIRGSRLSPSNALEMTLALQKNHSAPGEKAGTYGERCLSYLSGQIWFDKINYPSLRYLRQQKSDGRFYVFPPASHRRA